MRSPDTENTGADRILVISDAHLGQDTPGFPPTRERLERLLALLDREASRNDVLILLGDLFDFWFEYDHAIPREVFPFLARLAELRRRMRIYFVPGNHDFWAEDFFPQALGIPLRQRGVRLQVGGETVLFIHGDVLGPISLGGRFTRQVLGHPFLVRAFRWIHPDVGIRLAHFVSRRSRLHSDQEPVNEDRWKAGIRFFHQQGFHGVVMGHLHVPLLAELDTGWVMVTGDWMREFTYARLTPERFALYRDGEATPLFQRIPCSSGTP